jgi:hypothetical protein
MTGPGQQERGSALVTVAMLMLLAGILGAALVVFSRQQNRFRAAAEGDRGLQQALDLGYDKAIGAMNATASSWAAGPGMAGFTSLTYGAQSDLAGVNYWAMILAGARGSTLTGGTLDDVTVAAWPNNGDLNYDRTVVIHARHKATRREAWAVAVLHRNDAPPYLYGGDAMASTGNVTLGNNWTGKVYNSCIGTPGGTGALPNSAGTLNIGGSITSGWPNSDWAGYNNSQGTAPQFPPLTLPGVTLAVPGYAKTSVIVNQNITLSNAVNNTTANYQAAALDLGAKNIVVKGPGSVALWLTAASGGGNHGTVLGMNGSSAVVVNTNGSSQCCLAKFFTICVTADDPSISDNSVDWGGTPDGSFMLLAPLANMNYNGGGSHSFKGALVVKNLTVAPNSNAVFYYDACLAVRPPVDSYAKPPVYTRSWKRIR